MYINRFSLTLDEYDELITNHCLVVCVDEYEERHYALIYDKDVITVSYCEYHNYSHASGFDFHEYFSINELRVRVPTGRRE